MPRDLPKAYDPAAIEDRWAAYWVEEALFSVPHADTASSDAHLHHVAAPAECHRPAAHGAHAGTHRDGHPYSLAPHVRGPGAMDSRHRSCRHSHAVDGRAPACRRAQNTPAAGPRSLCRTGLAMEAALRRRHPRPDAPAGYQRRLVARVLHHGCAPLRSCSRGLRPAV